MFAAVGEGGENPPASLQQDRVSGSCGQDPRARGGEVEVERGQGKLTWFAPDGLSGCPGMASTWPPVPREPCPALPPPVKPSQAPGCPAAILTPLVCCVRARVTGRGMPGLTRSLILCDFTSRVGRGCLSLSTEVTACDSADCL